MNANQRTSLVSPVCRWWRHPRFAAVLVSMFFPAATALAVGRTITIPITIGDASNPPSEAGSLLDVECYFYPPHPSNPPGTDWSYADGIGGWYFYTPAGAWHQKCGHNLQGWGTVTITPSTDSLPFLAQGFVRGSLRDQAYFQTPYGYVDCPAGTPNDCNASFALEAKWGSVHGHVRLTDGTPVGGVPVAAYHGDTWPLSLMGTVTTDDEGHYTFTLPDHPPFLNDQNNWGLLVAQDNWWMIGFPGFSGPRGLSWYILNVGPAGSTDPPPSEGPNSIPPWSRAVPSERSTSRWE